MRQITDHEAQLQEAVTSWLERIIAAKLPTYLRKSRGPLPARYAATGVFFSKQELDMLQTCSCIPGASKLKCCQHSVSWWLILRMSTLQLPT